MDFTRGVRPPHNGSSGTSETAANTTTKGKNRKKWPKGISIAWIILLVSVSILILALVAFVVSSSRDASGDGKYIQEDKVQAVFLTNGQVYFGKIVGINDSNIRLQDVYYLTPTQSVQPGEGDNKQQQNTDYTLVKLGCELHGPQDQMIIERDQVTFWENLKDDGKVAQGVKQFKEANPNGLQCNTNTQQQQNDSNNN